MNIEAVTIESLHIPAWRTSYMLAKDRRALKAMIEKDGLLSVIIVQKSTGYILDGAERFKACESLGYKTIPAVLVDCDEADAIVMHLKLQRHHSDVIPKFTSRAIQRLARTERFDAEEVMKLLGMPADEYIVLLDGSLIKSKALKTHQYSKSWVPVETKGTEKIDMTIERPPNADS